MARGKSVKPSESLEPEEESQSFIEEEDESEEEEAEEGDEEEESEPELGKVSKSHAARVAIAEGYTDPGEAVDFISERFGIVMGNQHFSSIKSAEKKKAALAQANSRGQGRPIKERFEGARTGSAAGSGDREFLDDLASVKALVKKLGAEHVRKIVDLFD